MEYLRNLGSAAASSLLQKSGIAFPFSLGDKVASFEGKTIWSLYEAIKRDDSTPVSVFVFDSTQPPRKNLFPIAKNALRKLRTIRHPDVLKFIDVVETDSVIYIVTERVQPLGNALKSWANKSAKAKEDWLLWGIHRISVALAFINESCASTHGNVRVDSIFISPSGEWKLGGFDVLSNSKEEAAVLYTLGGLLPDANSYAPPEVKKGGWSALKELEPSVADSYALGILLHLSFNPSHPLPPTTQPPHPPPAPSSRGAIPPAVFPSYKRLLNPNTKARLSPKGFLDLGMSSGGGEGSGFFANNQLVQICSGLDNFSLGSESEKSALLKTLKESAASFPPEFAAHRVLPALVSALEFGGASAVTLLPLVLDLGKNVEPADYSNQVLAPLVKLFASPDRGTRMALLDNLPQFAEKLDQKTVVEKVWPHLQTGFSDTVAIIREATVRSIILISPKLNDRIMNNELLRHLAKMQMDPEASIRTNTCILIGRIAPSLGYNTKRKVLVPAFSRSLKDNFVHARVAGLMAFMATIDCYDPEDLASKVIPSLSFTLVDKEKLVRDQAFKAIDLFIKRLEAHVSTMPETELNANGQPSALGQSGLPNQTTLVNSAAGAAGALAGWAISSLGKKLATADLSSTMPNLDRPLSAPPDGSTLSPPFPSPTPSAMSSPSNANRVNLASSTSKAKAMQLGTNKVSASSFTSAAIAAEVADEAEESLAQAWADNDLMDVNADADDWGAFESATPENKSPQPQRKGLSPEVANHSWGVQAAPSSSSSLSSSAVHKPTATRLNPPKSNQSSTRPTPVSSPRPTEENGDWGPFGDEKPEAETPAAPAAPSLAGMSKEEKAAEMARRREERKQRIAQLKEQKKGKA